MCPLPPRVVCLEAKRWLHIWRVKGTKIAMAVDEQWHQSWSCFFVQLPLIYSIYLFQRKNKHMITLDNGGHILWACREGENTIGFLIHGGRPFNFKSPERALLHQSWKVYFLPYLGDKINMQMWCRSESMMTKEKPRHYHSILCYIQNRGGS